MIVLEELTGAVELNRVERGGSVTFRCRLESDKESDLVYLCCEDEPLPKTLDDLLTRLRKRIIPTEAREAIYTRPM